MFYITGDIHSDPKRFSKESFSEQKYMTKDDYVIILGDFGLVWEKEESKREKYWLDWLDSKPFTTIFIDGNHENFERLYSYPEEDWNGGKVHKIRNSVIHLMRGFVFDINGTKFFTFGGARSHDISGGILDRNDPLFKEKKKELDKEWLPYRILNETWWDLEIPTEEEIERGRKTIAETDYVDYVLTHCPPYEIYKFLKLDEESNRLTLFLNEVNNKLNYNVWLFGHLHEDMRINNKMIMLYEQITRLPEKVINKNLDKER